MTANTKSKYMWERAVVLGKKGWIKDTRVMEDNLIRRIIISLENTVQSFMINRKEKKVI